MKNQNFSSFLTNSKSNISDVAILMKNISKRFPNVIANDNVTFEARTGEIHALLGENGAGKTTLMNILYGMYQPDKGEIYLWGRKVKIRSPRDAIRLGIGMVHQHFKLIASLSVAENLALGLRNIGILLPVYKVKRFVEDFSRKYELEIYPDAKIWQLSAGERQRVEILKALVHGARILILDEPTTVLTPLERDKLFTMLRRMRNDGCSIIFITHKLKEVFLISDRVTILRKGKVVATLDTRSTNPEELAKLMIGQALPRLNNISDPKSYERREVLRVKDLYVLNDRGLLAVKGVSFSIHSGEIFGVAGISGNGQRELAEAIVGLRAVKSGQIVIEGEDVTNFPPRKILRKGVAYIPEDRIKVGIVPDMSIEENVILRSYWQRPFSGRVFLNFSFLNEWTTKLIQEYNVMTPNTKIPVKLLSGGNMQKVILARELSLHPRLLIAVYPTYGLDVSATQYVHSLFLKHKEQGNAILIVSEDPEEILALCDRVAVMFNGSFLDIKSAKNLSVKELQLMMAGIKI